MRLMVPHPGHFEALKEIIEAKESEGLNEVEEVYMGGSPEVMGSGRGVTRHLLTRSGNKPSMHINMASE